MTIRGVAALVWHLFVAALLVGCASPAQTGVSRPDVAQPRHRQPAAEIWGRQTVGQTFVAQKNGLNRIDLLLATYARENTGPVIFHLRESPTGGEDLATARFDASDVRDNAYRSFAFLPLRDSQNRSYYLFLEAPEAEPGNAITVWASPVDTYSQGQAYVAGEPQPGDLTFRTYAEYSIVHIGRDLWHGLRHHAGRGILAGLLFLLPGYAALVLLYPRLGQRKRCLGDWRSETGGFIILAAGLSVALAPLLTLLASLIGLRLGRGPVIALLGLSTVLAALPPLYQQVHLRPPTLPRPRSPAPLLLLLVFIISLAARLLIVGDLVAPMWGDSYHHTIIAQLMADHGGLFQSWEPYAPLQSFTYHFGFHSNVALFHWLTGMPVLESVIIVGQILNALAPLMIYPLVRRLGGTEWAGVIAVLIASLLSPMPARYVNWGRYTQLAGMVVLPVAATLTIDALSMPDVESENTEFGVHGNGEISRRRATEVVTTNLLRLGYKWLRLVLASVAVAGLLLSHYLVALLYIPLLLTYLIWWTGAHIQQENSHPSIPVRPWLRAGAIAVISGILITPWIPNLLSGPLPRVLASRFGSGVGATYFQTAYNVAGDVFAYVPVWLAVLAVVSAVWGCWQRQPLVIVMSIWTGLLVLVANPNIIGLPGAGVVNNFTLLIALYLPLSILAGMGLGQLLNQATERAPYFRFMAGALIIVAALGGARLRLMDLDYRYRLVTRADREAMQWICDHTPEDAVFLVNSFTAYGGYAVVGDDAGWWIPYLAGRRNMVPPATYGLELPSSPDYPTQVNAFYHEITAQSLDSPEAVQILRANGVTHVYIGAVGGDLLDPATLMQSPFYHLVYQRDGAMVFTLDEGKSP